MGESGTRCDDYLAAGASAIELVSRREVADRWMGSSALADWSVGGLAAHLLGQVFSVTSTLQEPTRGTEPMPLLTHYQRIPWRGAGLEAPANTAIRSAGDEQAEQGHAELVGRASGELGRLAVTLPTLRGDLVVQPPWTEWALSLDDFLTSRLMEIAVHSDDLAVSIGVEAPALPEGVARTVRHLLVDLAAQRHGDAAVVRALARSERAPRSIAAF